MNAPAAAPGPRPGPAVLGPLGAAAVLAMLMALQPVATDVYLPALPALRDGLGASMDAAQLTISALILSFGIGQLLWGPVADRVGRRPVLLATLGLFVAASVAGALAPAVEALIVCRAAQGFVLAGAVVCARAMVRDLYAPHEGAQVMALAMSGLGLVATVGPVLGGVVAAAAGWRAALWTVTLYGAIALAVIVWRVPETLAVKNPRATALGPMLANWWEIGRHPNFIAWAMLVTCAYGGIFTYLAGSAFVFIGVLGLSPAFYGLAMASVSCFYLAATFVCRKVIRQRGLAGAVRMGGGFTLAAALGFAVVGATGWASPWVLLVPQWLYAIGHGFHMPCGQTGTVAAFPRKAGAASALAGFVMALVAFVVGRWMGAALDDTVRPYALGLAFWSAATCGVAWTLVQRHGQVR